MSSIARNVTLVFLLFHIGCDIVGIGSDEPIDEWVGSWHPAYYSDKVGKPIVSDSNTYIFNADGTWELYDQRTFPFLKGIYQVFENRFSMHYVAAYWFKTDGYVGTGLAPHKGSWTRNGDTLTLTYDDTRGHMMLIKQ